MIDMLWRQRETGRWYGAICASPAYVLEPHGLLEDCEATCFPALRDRLKTPAQPDRPVVVSGTCITSQGPGTAMEYSLSLVELLFNRKLRNQLAEGLLVSQA
jgi:protein deglycase